MSNTIKKKNEDPSSNFIENNPKDQVPKGNKVVKDQEDKIYEEKEFSSKYEDVAQQKENAEQPVNPIKKAPKE